MIPTKKKWTSSLISSNSVIAYKNEYTFAHDYSQNHRMYQLINMKQLVAPYNLRFLFSDESIVNNNINCKNHDDLIYQR